MEGKMDAKVPITPAGLSRLKDELQALIGKARPQIQRAIAEARAHGDLRENAEYHAAKEKQGMIEGRIQEINAKLPALYTVDPARQQQDQIAFGAKVRIANVDTGEEMTYQLVGPDETDLSRNLISYLSPMARALIGKRSGETVKVRIPKGNIEVEVTDIVYQ